MTGFMLDTDISSYIIRRRPAILVETFEKHAETLSVSVMTAAELRFGAEKAGRPKLTEMVGGVLRPTCDSRLDRPSQRPLCTDSLGVGTFWHADREYGSSYRVTRGIPAHDSGHE